MTPVIRLVGILTSKSWRENLDTWSFDKNTIMIKEFSRPGTHKVLRYVVEPNGGNQFILKTDDPTYGDFLLYINFDDPQTEIVLQSTSKKARYYKLQDFHGFSAEEKDFVERRLIQLREEFECKKREIEKALLETTRSANPNKNLNIRCEKFITQTQNRLEMIELVIRTTLGLATNFNEYVKQLESDVHKLENEIRSFQIHSM